MICLLLSGACFKSRTFQCLTLCQWGAAQGAWGGHGQGSWPRLAKGMYKLSMGVSETLRMWQLKLVFVEQVWQCMLSQYKKKKFLLGVQIMNALSPVHSVILTSLFLGLSLGFWDTCYLKKMSKGLLQWDCYQDSLKFSVFLGTREIQSSQDLTLFYFVGSR